LRLLSRQGELTVTRITVELGIPRNAVRRALTHRAIA
jgi:predicted ArsR family transcriptional regulator